MLVRYLFICVINKIFKMFNQTQYYQSKYGIKAFNRVFDNQQVKLNIEYIECNPRDLLLGIDGLKDKYTNCGKTIIDSPHYRFMDELAQGINLKKSEYINLERIGALDGRDSFWRPNSYHKKLYKERSDKKNGNQGNLVSLYIVNNKYYISDGKHRVALMAYMNIEKITCMVIQFDNSTLQYFKILYRMMKANSSLYSLNLQLLEEILKEKCQEDLIYDKF